MFDEANDLEAGNGGGDQMQVSVGIGGDGRDRRQLGPTGAVAQDGRLALGRPGSARRGQQGEIAFVHKHQRGLQLLGFFSSGAKSAEPNAGPCTACRIRGQGRG